MNNNNYLQVCLSFYSVDMFQQECIPNANVEVCGNIVKIWAIKRIQKSEKVIGLMLLLFHYNANYSLLICSFYELVMDQRQVNCILR